MACYKRYVNFSLCLKVRKRLNGLFTEKVTFPVFLHSVCFSETYPLLQCGRPLRHCVDYLNWNCAILSAICYCPQINWLIRDVPKYNSEDFSTIIITEYEKDKVKTKNWKLEVESCQYTTWIVDSKETTPRDTNEKRR